MKRYALILVAFASLLFLDACKTGKEVQLTFNPQLGKKYLFTTEMEITTSTTGAAENMSTQQRMRFEYLLEMVEKKNNIYHVKVSYDRVQWDIDNGPGGKMQFDTRSPAPDADPMTSAMGNIFSGLIGKSVNMEVNERGEVLKVEGIDRIVDEIGAGLMQSIPDGAMNINAFKQSYNDKTFAGQMEQAIKIYPTEAVSTGDSWELDKVIAVAGNSKTKTRYTLKDIKDGKAFLDFSSVIDQQLQQGALVINSNGSDSGTIEVDLPTGMIISNNAKIAFTMKNTYQGEEVAMEAKGTMKSSCKLLTAN